MFEGLRKSVANAIAPPRRHTRGKNATLTKPIKRDIATAVKAAMPGMQQRMYQAAKGSRLTAGFGSSTTSADSELVSSLTNLRNRSRALVRDAAYAKRAKVVVQSNVIGSGIGMQAQVMSSRDTLREDVNDAIEEAWKEWSCAEYCHTGGTMDFSDLERALMGQIFDAGEVFVRKHYRAFGGSKIPFALELIEAERIADEFMNPVPPGPAAPGAMVKMGIEQDRYGRPLAYWIRSRHPGELRFIQGETDKIERVPADQIEHLRLVDRWPQTRGEPWLHAVARKLNDMDGYSEAEIVAARGAASYVFTIETPEDNSPPGGTPLADGASGAAIQKEIVVEPGMGTRLAPGEEWKTHAPNRPNTALDPFMRYMLREISAGCGPSYESISRDYSQSNFSSSQIAVHEDRDLWRIIQQSFIRMFRYSLHSEWLQQAVLARAIKPIRLEEYAVDPRKFEAVAFKPRGWGWIQPRTDVPAMIEAVAAGFITLSDVIAMTCNGKDFWDVMKERQRELKILKELGLEFSTSPAVYMAKAIQPAAATSASAQDPAADSTPADGAPPDPNATKSSTQNDPPSRVVSFQR